MKFDNQTQIEGYLRLLEELKSKTLDDATALTLVQQIAQDERIKALSRSSTSQEVTPKQLAFLEKLEVQHEPNISKTEASRLIDEALAKQRNENDGAV